MLSQRLVRGAAVPQRAVRCLSMAAPRRAAQPGVGSSVPQPPVVEAPTQPRLGRGLAATALLFAGCLCVGRDMSTSESR
jgi:hypothetical protein